MTRILLALALVILGASSAFAQATATPTPTVTPTPTLTVNNLATPTQTAAVATPVAPAVAAEPHAVVHARGRCVVDPPQMPSVANGVPGTTKVECGVPGAQPGDLVLATLFAYDVGSGFYESLQAPRCRVATANRIECKLMSSASTTWNPGSLTIDYLVLQ